MTETDISDYRAWLKKSHKKRRRGWLWHMWSLVLALLHLLASARFPKLAIYTAVLLFTLLKALIVLDIGESRYRTRLASYHDPTLAQRIGVLVMTPDKMTLKLRDLAKVISGN